jgi:hypothetical protein
MPTHDPDKLTLEKLRLNQRMESIEAYIIEGKKERADLRDFVTRQELRCTNLEFMIHGDSKSSDKYIRDGMNRRIDSLEGKEKELEKIKGSFLKIAIGSITLAVGAFVLWLCRLVWGAIGK